MRSDLPTFGQTRGYAPAQSTDRDSNAVGVKALQHSRPQESSSRQDTCPLDVERHHGGDCLWIQACQLPGHVDNPTTAERYAMKRSKIEPAQTGMESGQSYDCSADTDHSARAPRLPIRETLHNLVRLLSEEIRSRDTPTRLPNLPVLSGPCRPPVHAPKRPMVSTRHDHFRGAASDVDHEWRIRLRRAAQPELRTDRGEAGLPAG